jgi:hypothetical protein
MPRTPTSSTMTERDSGPTTRHSLSSGPRPVAWPPRLHPEFAGIPHRRPAITFCRRSSPEGEPVWASYHGLRRGPYFVSRRCRANPAGRKSPNSARTGANRLRALTTQQKHGSVFPGHRKPSLERPLDASQVGRSAFCPRTREAVPARLRPPLLYPSELRRSVPAPPAGLEPATAAASLRHRTRCGPACKYPHRPK